MFKKETFGPLMGLEITLAMISMGLLFSDVGALIYLISAALFATVLAPFYLKLKKTEDEAKKRKIRLRMFLIMLIPIAVALAAIVTVVGALLIYYW